MPARLGGPTIQAVDVSAFDFTASELTDLLLGLAPVTKAIDVEPRLHRADEMAHTREGWVPLHEGLAEPTFRIRCRLRSDGDVLAQLGDLAVRFGLSTVFDHDGWVRLRRLPAEAATG